MLWLKFPGIQAVAVQIWRTSFSKVWTPQGQKPPAMTPSEKPKRRQHDSTTAEKQQMVVTLPSREHMAGMSMKLGQGLEANTTHTDLALKLMIQIHHPRRGGPWCRGNWGSCTTYWCQWWTKSWQKLLLTLPKFRLTVWHHRSYGDTCLSRGLGPHLRQECEPGKSSNVNKHYGHIMNHEMNFMAMRTLYNTQAETAQINIQKWHCDTELITARLNKQWDHRKPWVPISSPWVYVLLLLPVTSAKAEGPHSVFKLT